MFDYTTKEVEQGLQCVGESSSITGSLERKKQQFEKDLQVVNEALEALKANPEVTKLIELVNKAR